MATAFDYAAEGFLDGLESDARAQRVALLDQLFDDGADVEEVREALADGRLALLGTERALAGERRHSLAEIADLSGVPIEIVEAQRRALGLIVGDPDARELSAEDLEAAHRIRTFLDAGITGEGLSEMSRVMAMSMSQFAAANREVIGPLFTTGTTGEKEVAERLEALTAELLPLIGPTLEYAYRRQLREQLRHVAIGGAGLGLEGPDAAAGTEMGVAFADLVGFTRLGERLPPEQIGGLTGRLGELAAERATGAVRLIKLIGDATMFGSTDIEPLLAAVLDLVDAAEAEGEEFPELRAGVAFGPVVSRGGDLYGATVNLASRLTGAARPGSVLVTERISDELDGRFRFSTARHKRLKGIKDPVHMIRARKLEEQGE